VYPEVRNLRNGMPVCRPASPGQSNPGPWAALHPTRASAFSDRGSRAPGAGSLAAPMDAAPPAHRGIAGLLTRARNIGAEDTHDGLFPADTTPWLSFIE